jgi:hypothetical protein
MKRDFVVLHGNHAPLGECERVIFKNSENEFRYGRTFQSLQPQPITEGFDAPETASSA